MTRLFMLAAAAMLILAAFGRHAIAEDFDAWTRGRV
jgi:hypothetical protein